MDTYEKKYKKALQKIRELIEKGRENRWTITSYEKDFEEMFPELKESEDEKIRDEICIYIGAKQDISLDTHNRWLSWLEKQGNHSDFLSKIQIGDKVTRNRDGVLVNLSQLNRVAKPSDKVEPKFKVGDWVVYYRNDHSREVLQIYDIRDGRYYFTDNVHFSWSVKECDEKSHLWTIQDAKEGDVLINWNNTIFIFKTIEDETVKFHIAYNDKWGTIKNPVTRLHHLGLSRPPFEFHPATKEQRDLLFQKMHEAGYKWDAGKKELKKCEQKPMDEDKTEIYDQFTPFEERLYALIHACQILSDESKIKFIKKHSQEILDIVKKQIEIEQKLDWSEEDEFNGEDYGIDSLWHAQRILEKTLGSVDGYQTDDGILSHKCAISAVKKLYEHKPTEWKQENIEELTKFENAMMHIGGSFFGENAGLDPNNTAQIKEQAELLLELAPKTEWSEEDEKRLQSCLNILQAKGIMGVTETINTKWLKSLKQRIKNV